MYVLKLSSFTRLEGPCLDIIFQCSVQYATLSRSHLDGVYELVRVVSGEDNWTFSGHVAFSDYVHLYSCSRGRTDWIYSSSYGSAVFSGIVRVRYRTLVAQQDSTLYGLELPHKTQK